VKIHSKTLALSAILGAWVVAPAALAAEELTEIVVTAQKREQKAQDVGIAMSVLTGDEMSDLHYTNLQDIVAQSPGVEARNQFPARGLRTNIFIRGVGSTDFNDATETPVGIYVDDFYMLSPSTADFSLMDIARAEVLKGPQSTLFGRNTNGGAVQFVTNTPQFDAVSADLKAGVGDYTTQQLTGVLNAPLNSMFAIRVVAQLDDHACYTKNLYPGGLCANDQHYTAARVSLRFKPNDAVDAIYKFENGSTRGNFGETDPLVTIGLPNGDVARNPTNTNAYGYNPSSNGTDQPGYIDAQGYLAGYNKVQSHVLRVNWNVAQDVELTSITGFLDQRYAVYEDCSGTPSIICNYEGFLQSRHYSQEFRLNGAFGRTNWTAGLYYLHQNSQGGLAAPLYYSTANGLPAPGPTTAGQFYLANFVNAVSAPAAFGQLEYKVVDTVTLIGGLRLANDNRDFRQVYNVYDVLTPNNLFPVRSPDFFLLSSHEVEDIAVSSIFTPATAGDLTNQDHTAVSGTAQINWQPAQHELFYASIRRGVKAAGFNNGSVPVGAITTTQYPFGEEKLLAYEIGEKVSLADDRLRINSAVFYYDYHDYQAIAFTFPGITQTNKPASIDGAELDIAAIPLEGLSVGAGLALLHTEVKDVSIGAGAPPADKEMGEAPSMKANALVRYQWPAFAGDLSVQFSGDHVGARWTDVENLSVGRLPAYTLVDGQIGYEASKNGFNVLLWARNITNEKVPLNSLATLTFVGIGQQKWNEPLTVGVTVGVHF